MDQRAIEKSVADVIAAVRERGDEALVDFTRQWDGVSLTPETLRVPGDAIAAADTTGDFGKAFGLAVERIRRFHREVKPRSTTVEDADGGRLGLRWTPIRAVGLYVPGGKASYPSTLAMTAIPAQIAGVERIAVVSPPGPDGEVSSQILLASRVLGIDEVYRIGGAQAIAALAIGTATIPRVDKIFGPGNAFVTEAKKQLYGEVGIDMLAGPSEVVVFADRSANPEWVAADLLAQAEHDEDTRPTLIASDEQVLTAVRRAIARRIENEPRRAVISAALERNGKFLVVSSVEQAAARINEIAPEHLSIQVEEPMAALAKIRNAGAIFIGPNSAVAMGDYYAGPNHVLPTGGTARFASCLSVEDFMKRSNVCELTASFVRRHGASVEELAEGERLPAHRASIAVRRSAGPQGARRGFSEVDAYQLVEEVGDVKLNQNESPWDIPDEIKDEILDAMRTQHWNRYHQSVGEELRRDIARAVGLDSSTVFVGNGSNLLLQWLFEAFGGPGRVALIPSPSFSLYRMWGTISDTRIDSFRLVEEDLGGGRHAFEYPIDEVCERIEKTRPALTVLCLPNNPTGTDLGPEHVEAILRAAEDAGGWVIIDEAYVEFSRRNSDRADLARQGRRVFLLRTFSKALAAAGLRIGYLLTNDEGADAIAKIVPPFHIGLFNAVAGRTLWRRRDIFEERVATIARERTGLMDAFRALPDARVYSSSGNFFMIRLASAEALREALQRRGILVRKLWKDPALENCLRINIGTPEENGRLLEAVREFFRR